MDQAQKATLEKAYKTANKIMDCIDGVVPNDGNASIALVAAGVEQMVGRIPRSHAVDIVTLLVDMAYAGEVV